MLDQIKSNQGVKLIKNIVLSFILLFLFGCATGYHKIGLNGGYESEILENGNIHITYWGNGYTALAKTIDYWERQAHELCPNGFEVLSRRDVC